MSVLVFGYHNVGTAGLRALLDGGAEVAALVTHRDDPDENVWFEPPAALARERDIPVHTPESAKGPELRGLVEAIRPKFIFSFYYRWMIPSRVLNLAPGGAYNLHGSLLPRLRGRCPVNWAILLGEAESGLTLHHMVAAADAGDIVAQARVAIEPRETAKSLFDKLTPLAYRLVAENWPPIRDGRAPRIPQDESKATTYGGRRPEDGLIDWRRGAVHVDRLVRAVTHPYPGAFTFVNGRKLFVWKGAPAEGFARPPCGGQGAPGAVLASEQGAVVVGCGEGDYSLERAQFDGGPEVPARELGLSIGTILGG
jgi:methionyl-tRNA formyltransferase